jgi:PTS system beta-glucosides-specific IIC component
MADTKKLASSILEAVGGKDNITFITHCMTRLRLNLKDESIVDDEGVRKIKGVVGVRRVAGQYQIIIGTSVDEVCTELIALAGLSQEEGHRKTRRDSSPS